MNARRPLFNCIVAPLAAGPMSPDDAKSMLDNYRAENRAEVLAEVDGQLAAMTLPDELKHTPNAGSYGDAWDDCRAVVREMAGKDTRGAVQASADESTQLPLQVRIYDSLTAFNQVACWDVLRLAQMRQYLAEHLAGELGPREGAFTQADRTDVLNVRWDREVIHPAKGTDESTIVCCIAADTGQPVALFLDDEHREALGLSLIDSNPDDAGDEEDEAPAPGFFEVGATYQRGRWTFTCLAIAPRPWSGETRAVGYLSRSDGTGTETALGQRDWTDAGWTEVAEGGEPRG